MKKDVKVWELQTESKSKRKLSIRIWSRAATGCAEGATNSVHAVKDKASPRQPGLQSE